MYDATQLQLQLRVRLQRIEESKIAIQTIDGAGGVGNFTFPTNQELGRVRNYTFLTILWCMYDATQLQLQLRVRLQRIEESKIAIQTIDGAGGVGNFTFPTNQELGRVRNYTFLTILWCMYDVDATQLQLQLRVRLQRIEESKIAIQTIDGAGGVGNWKFYFSNKSGTRKSQKLHFSNHTVVYV